MCARRFKWKKAINAINGAKNSWVALNWTLHTHIIMKEYVRVRVRTCWTMPGKTENKPTLFHEKKAKMKIIVFYQLRTQLIGLTIDWNWMYCIWYIKVIWKWCLWREFHGTICSAKRLSCSAKFCRNECHKRWFIN